MGLALQLLTAIASESEVQLSRAARTEMLGALGKRSDQVLQLLGAVLESFAGAAPVVASCTAYPAAVQVAAPSVVHMMMHWADAAHRD